MEHCLFDTIIFPAIIYHMKEPKASLLIFSTGNIICVGVNNKKTLLMAILKLKKMINKLEAEIMNSHPIKCEDAFFV